MQIRINADGGLSHQTRDRLERRVRRRLHPWTGKIISARVDLDEMHDAPELIDHRCRIHLILEQDRDIIVFEEGDTWSDAVNEALDAAEEHLLRQPVSARYPAIPA